jgi:endo-1,4-beta-xylanase
MPATTLLRSHPATILAACLVWSIPAWAQTSLLPPSPLSSFQYYDWVPGGSATVVSVAGQPFQQAVRISTAGGSAAIWGAQLAWPTAGAVAASDALLARFWARRLSPAGTPIAAQLVFERNGGDYEKSLTTSFPADDSTWRLYAVPFRASASFAAGDARFAFQFSAGPQSFEVGGVTLENFGQVDPATLPTAFYYPGREADAPWRAQAEAAITQHRTAPVNVRVLDASGRPVRNADVRIVQRTQAFRFGTAVAADRLVSQGPDGDRYRRVFLENFNAAVVENHFKWPFWESWARADGERALAWLRDRGIPVRGHNLIWPDWGNMPPDTSGLAAPALRARINAHFDQFLSLYRGQFFEWDVVNEPFSSFDVMGRIPGVAGVAPSPGVLGNAEIVQWFQRARQLDPGARLALNDYNLLESFDSTHRAYTLALLEWMRQQGAPVDTLGLQGHFGLVPVPDLQARLAQFAALPVRLAITEYDLPSFDGALQADYLRDVLTLVYAEPKFDQFMMWGFWEGAHWKPDAAMFRLDWTPKPAAAVWLELTRGRWWTNAAGTTLRDGTFSARAHLGEVQVTATYQGTLAATQIVNVAQPGVTVELRLAPALAPEPTRKP